MTRRRYAIIPTHNRPKQFAACLEAIAPQVDLVFVVSHDASYTEKGDFVRLRYNPSALPNISRIWNLGLREAEYVGPSWKYDVAVLNDDCVVPPDWFDSVTARMRHHEASAGCSGADYDFVSHAAEPVHLSDRLTGYAFILDGAAKLFADERFQWWYGDDDLDWRARQLGGMVKISGHAVDHPPNGGGTTVGELATIAGEDRQRFIEKWGKAPW